MTSSVRLLGTAVALGTSLLAAGLLPSAAAFADSDIGKAGDVGEDGAGFSVCKPISFTGQITVQCSVAPNGGAADGEATAAVAESEEDSESSDD
ncbi:hypothetical protein GCM10011581_14040 [Saccharopolyspora subtropica]|uniref:Secreted protein n=1 Tax=Saccharopolyspora thermophila TaxID=89367 RepID=A0A917N8L4_9PSEU|nr:hypothetical protein [Saccharopolyspora subtropica]GGI78143.1 hypothetical protein GCM10011581_14040 [Saccharopolyspora subtropica]